MKIWYSWDVVNFCIRHRYYTHGTVNEYNRMQDYVSKNRNPTLGDVKRVAIDIVCHSEGLSIFDDDDHSVHDVMDQLFKEVVTE